MISSLEFPITSHHLSEVSARLDTEDLVISYLIQNPLEITNLTNLNSVCFEIKENRIAYNALAEMAKKDMPIDPINLEIYLERQGDLAIVGGSSAVAAWAGGSLLNPTPTQSSVDAAIAHMVEIYKRKQLLKDLKKLEGQILDLSLTYDQLAVFAESYLLEFLKGKQSLAIGLRSIESTMPTSIEKIINRSMNKQDGVAPESILTGFPDLDKLTGGWQRSDLIVVAGRTSMGKSALVQNTLLEIASKLPVAMFSLEMSDQQMNERFISIATKIDAAKIRDGDLTEIDYDKILTAGEKLKQLNYWGCDKSNLSIDFIAAECRRLAAKNGGMGAIAIDHAGLMIENHDNPRADINRITSKSKALAMELNCPVFLVSQINRSTEARNEKRPQLADLAESGRLEQDANVVVMIYRDDYYNPGSVDAGLAEVIIRKNRGGECGTTKLIYEANTTTFKSIAKKY